MVHDDGARGGGLGAMTRRLHEIGGRLFIQAQPHFRLTAVVEGAKTARCPRR